MSISYEAKLVCGVKVTDEELLALTPKFPDLKKPTAEDIADEITRSLKGLCKYEVGGGEYTDEPVTFYFCAKKTCVEKGSAPVLVHPDEFTTLITIIETLVKFGLETKSPRFHSFLTFY